jgi:hypothetical protein
MFQVQLAEEFSKVQTPRLVLSAMETTESEKMLWRSCTEKGRTRHRHGAVGFGRQFGTEPLKPPLLSCTEGKNLLPHRS